VNLAKLIRYSCANYDQGKCLGCKIKKTYMMVDETWQGKPCWAAVKRCKYFENIVLPGLTKEHPDYHRMEIAIHKSKMMKEGDYGPPESDKTV